MSVRPPETTSPLTRGAVHGALAGLVFGIVECWLLSVLPMVLRPSFAYTPVHPGFTAFTLAAYPVLGAVAGAIVGALTAGIPSFRGHPVVGSIAVILGVSASLAQLLFQGPDSPFAFRQSPVHIYVPIAVAALLLLAGAVRGADGPDSRRFRFATNPLTVSVLLLGLPWTTIGVLARSGPGAKAAAMLAVPLGILAVSFILERALARVRTAPGRLTGVLVLVAFATWGMASSREQAVREAGVLPDANTASADLPNVLLITLDTVRADHLSLYGYERETTPELEQFARGATLYRRSVASGDMTLTTHGSLFTGLYPRQHGAHRSEAIPTGRPLSGKFDTIAELLAARGYWTQAVVANTAYLSNTFGFDQGFHSYDARGAVLFLGNPPAYSPRRLLRAAVTPFVPRTVSDRRYRDASQINDEVIARVERIRQRNTPFFLFVNYMDAHVPLLPPPPFDRMWPGKDPDFTTDHYYDLLQSIIRGDGGLPESDRQHLISQYDGAIAYLDTEVRRLFDALREAGLWENTLVIVTSDHGEAFGEKSLINHGVSVYQNQIGIPLVIREPGQTRSATSDVLANSVDVLPTIADITGTTLPRQIPGQSLRGLAEGTSRAVASESYPFLFDLNPAFKREERAVMYGTLKLVSSTTGKRELYDLSRDADEMNNLYDPADSVTQALEERLDAWMEVMVAETDTSSFELDEAARDRLRALGYLH